MIQRPLILPGTLLFCLLLPLSSHAGKVSYTYDDLHRLTDAVSPDGLLSIAYSFDKTGNRLTKVVTETDSDFDSLPDRLENSTCTNSLDADSDDDGLADGIEDANHNGIVDTGETDPCNIDSDGDGIQDGTESGITTPVADPDGAGPLQGTDTSVFQPDLDPQTTTNPLLADSDGDGLSDGVEDANHNGRFDPGEYNPGIPAPIITDIVPDSRVAGTEVVIHGAHFGSLRGNGQVIFSNGVYATVITQWSDTSITCIVPTGAVSGCVRVLTDGGPGNCWDSPPDSNSLVPIYLLLLNESQQ